MRVDTGLRGEEVRQGRQKLLDEVEFRKEGEEQSIATPWSHGGAVLCTLNKSGMNGKGKKKATSRDEKEKKPVLYKGTFYGWENP